MRTECGRAIGAIALILSSFFRVRDEDKQTDQKEWTNAFVVRMEAAGDALRVSLIKSHMINGASTGDAQVRQRQTEQPVGENSGELNARGEKKRESKFITSANSAVGG